MAELTILTINSGSSSLKASLFQAGSERKNFHYKHLDSNHAKNYANAFKAVLEDLANIQPDIIGHRFVHGGEVADAAEESQRDARSPTRPLRNFPYA